MCHDFAVKHGVKINFLFLVILEVWQTGCTNTNPVVETKVEMKNQMSTIMKKTDQKKDDLLKKLSPEQFAVTQQCSTEPPFKNAYWNNHEAGIYVDVVDGTPLFSSTDKFDSGSGWPSFTRPIDSSMVTTKMDQSHGMDRVEVKSKTADSHLGHIFDDGPGPEHKRYCINSSSLRFVPVSNLKKEGYEQYLKLFDKNPVHEDDKTISSTTEKALLAGGCFWGMQDLIRKIPGVISTTVGYTGGETSNPKYDDVKTGRTGHAESVEIVFDPKKLSYATLLDFFFKMHDPTTVNQQGNDVGTQYRSALFYESEKQKEVAQEKIKEWEVKWKKPIVTQLLPAKPFFKAEDYHQDYLKRQPHGYTCHFYRNFQ